MSNLAQQLIQENKKTKEKFLDLSSCGITEIPEELYECTWLEEVILLSSYFNIENLNELLYSDNYIHPELVIVKPKNQNFVNRINHSNVDDFEKLKALKKLFLPDIGIKDFSFLEGLPNLQYLDIPVDRGIDVTHICKLADLEFLNLSGTITGNIEFLKPLTRLKYLTINLEKITDCSVLGDLRNLEYLALEVGYVSNFNISFLKELQFLRFLSLKIYNNLNECQPIDLNELSHLTNLKFLSTADSQIKNIDCLQVLPNFKYFILEKNENIDMNLISRLKKLQHLQADYCKIPNVAVLTNNKELHYLRLKHNEIKDITYLKELQKLREIHLSDNKIKYFDSSLLVNLPCLEVLALNENPIKNIPPEIFRQDNCLFDIKNYFKDKEKGVKSVFEVKLILVGNGRVGKTCLVKRLLDNTFDSEEPSTHAIQIREWSLPQLAKETGLEKVVVNIWDFGGQDIYHTTHRLFMKTKAIFLLVWDRETQMEIAQTEVLTNGISIKYKNHRLPYWLSFIQILSSNSPVLLVQTKIKNDGLMEPFLFYDEIRHFNIIDRLAVDSSLPKANGFRTLHASIEEVITKEMENSSLEMPEAWYEVRREITKRRNKGMKQIYVSVFLSICKGVGMSENSANTLLKYFHNTGFFFYQTGLFNNQIVIDQKWAIDAVYTVLARKGHFARMHHNGEFSTLDLQEVWKEYTHEEQMLFISFMKQCEICFEVSQNFVQNTSNLSFIKKYIAPQLLPEEQPKSVDFAFNGRNEVWYRYQYRFLHAVVVQRLIVRVGFWAATNEMWKEGVIVRTMEGIALIQSSLDSHQVLIRLKGKKKQVLLQRIKNELKSVNYYDEHILESVSLDSITYVSLNKLRNYPSKTGLIEAEDGTWERVEDYHDFLKDDESKSFAELKIKPHVRVKEDFVTEIFFSYAWGEEREKIVDSLYDSLIRDGYTLVRDKKDAKYRGLISAFMKEIGRGHIIVIAISDKYLRSQYCMYEFYEMYRNAKLDRDELLKKILPIQVEKIDLSNPKVLGNYFEYWKSLELEWRELVNEYGASQSEHRKIEAIKNAVRDLLPFISDINTLTNEQLSANNFQIIKETITQRIKEINQM